MSKTINDLINKIPLRLIEFRTPFEILIDKNAFKVPPKIFGCIYFVHNITPRISKLDI
jgi:hypothetical protein